ncbi:hypothetical protein [Vreelandella venusta]|uniref:Uncharacterized protein n=1 Tax=Vreelandella venusta TaxID=44935 RepID=A0ABX2BAG0_9GAMM|nr:hypothetical protein [Halomonas venusta]AZM95117.1 hypothetical protein EI420_05170 [Halomonas venusta]NPT29626.1 hypothetical protein [Halomonas venusta]
MSDKKGNKERSPLHHRYIMGILAGVIVALLAVNWSQVSGLPEMLNMALALSSLILAGLAIIYSFHTSGSLNKTLENIEYSSTSIKIISDEIQKSNQELSKKIGKIPDDISEIKNKVDSSMETLGGIPNLIKNLHKSTNQHIPPSKREIEISEAITSKLIENGGVFTTSGFIMLKIAYEEGLELVLHGKAPNEFIRTSILHALELATALDLITLDINDTDDQKDIIKIKELKPIILNNIEEALLKSSSNDSQKASKRRNSLRNIILKHFTYPIEKPD